MAKNVWKRVTKYCACGDALKIIARNESLAGRLESIWIEAHGNYYAGHFECDAPQARAARDLEEAPKWIRDRMNK